MRILYFSQFYKPENIAPAFRATDHSRLWAEAGHDVTVFTGWPNYPTGKLFDGYDMVRLGQEDIDGVRVFRSASRIQPNTSFKKRIECGASFIVGGLKNLGAKSPVGDGYDVVLVTCGTVFSAWLGVHYAKEHGLPLVVEFRDLTYKQMVATGSSESSANVRAMKALELSFCKAADCVVVLTEGFKKDLAAEGVDPSVMFVVPNGADIVTCGHAWGERLRLGYFGTMGLSQDLPTTLSYAVALAGKGLAESYLLVGEGAARADIERAMTAAPEGFLRLEHGMPVLFVGPEGDASKLVRDSGAGLALCATESEDLAALEEFAGRADLAEVLKRMSAAAVDFMERNYTRKRMADQMLSVLVEAVNKTQQE